MNLTCLAGLVVFLQQSIQYKSLISSSIFINGLLYHSFQNIFLKILDITANFFYTCYVVYHEQQSRPFALFGICSYVFNIKCKNDLIHVYCVQFPLAIGLNIFLEGH